MKYQLLTLFIIIVFLFSSCFENNSNSEIDTISKNNEINKNSNEFEYNCKFDENYAYNSQFCNQCYTDATIVKKNNKNYDFLFETLTYISDIQHERELFKKFRIVYSFKKEKEIEILDSKISVLKFDTINDVCWYYYKKDTLIEPIDKKSYNCYLKDNKVFAEKIFLSDSAGEMFRKRETYFKNNEIILERYIEHFDNTWQAEGGGENPISHTFQDFYFININDSSYVFEKNIDVYEKTCKVKISVAKQKENKLVL